jgi:uncharacterized protein (DUF1330 family)
MAYYMVLEIEVQDPTAYADYVSRVPETVAKYGGRYLVRGGAVQPLIGGWQPERLVILEFPTRERMQEWNASAEYQELAAIRERSTRGRAIGVQGCRPDGSADS